MPAIKSISSRKILNSASEWTIETKLELADGSLGIASIPGGISKGKNEAVSIDADNAVKRAGELKKKLERASFDTQLEFDRFLIKLDGTKNKSRLGANTILSLSIAFCKASAKSLRKEPYQHIRTILTEMGGKAKGENKIPKMMMLILEGGVHGAGKATIQEFMTIVNNIRDGDTIYDNVHRELRRLGESTNVGAEGAFSPINFDNEQILSFLSGYLSKGKIALDAATSSFPEGTQYPDYDSLLKAYPIISIEDPFKEDDWANWEKFAKDHLDKIQIVTDDLTSTNTKILKKAIDKKIANATIVKPNQIGSLTETLEFISLAKENGWKTIVSHRGTDTNDDFIADLAVGTLADYVKFGAPARGERVAKYNRLLQIGIIL